MAPDHAGVVIVRLQADRRVCGGLWVHLYGEGRRGPVTGLALDFGNRSV